MTRPPRTLIPLLVLATLAGAAAEDIRLRPDKPFPPPKSGAVTGRVRNASKAEKLTLVSRVTGKRRRPDKWNRSAGTFRFADLPGDATYDLCLTLPDGREIEGIDLAFVDARLLRLAKKRRKQLGLKPEPDRPFTAEDAKAILEHTKKLPDFMDLRRILYLKGHGRRATMLVEAMRTRDFHAGKGAYVWRIELWYFKNHFDGWEKLANQERLLRRARTSPETWRRIHVEYYPDLSVYIDPEGESEPVEFTVPGKPDPSRGRVAGAAPKLKTEPHVLGVETPER